MIDTIYQIIKTVLNKELRGNVTPDEFNKIAKQVQDEIFEQYFSDLNLQLNKKNRGLTNLNYGNLPKYIRQKITRFHEDATLTYTAGLFDLPNDLYFIEDNGLMYQDNVIEEGRTSEMGYMKSYLGAPSTVFPVYESFKDAVKVHPTTIISGVTCSYLRRPVDPKWTYIVANNIEFFNIASVDYQDFELHVSELPNIVVRMLSYFGVNIRESDVVQYAEMLKQKEQIKEQQ